MKFPSFKNLPLRTRFLATMGLVFTISIGLAGFPRDGDTPAQIVKAADQALYRAKQQGRNLMQGRPG